MTADSVVYDPNSLPDLLPLFYRRLFPYGLYFKWLNYGGVEKNYFSNREFSFTLKDDIYIRYQSFNDQDEMEKEIQKRCPYKIDLGAVFSINPKLHQKEAKNFIAKERELVFDIDMTDYDDVRNCCSGADICKKCWPLMTIAVKVIDKALEYDFGFEHRLWVYSGRRGVHCWVCDETARKLSQNGRSAIAEYLSVVKGGEQQFKKVSLKSGKIHPHVRRSLGVIYSHWQEYAIQKQDILGTRERQQKFIDLVSKDEVGNIRETLDKDFTQFCKNSRQCWSCFEKRVQDMEDQGGGQYQDILLCSEEIQLQYAYPRLDVNVSKGVNHLLKSPFCVHPKTGRVCVPFDAAQVTQFDPFSVPTIADLCDELDKLDVVKDEEGRRVKSKDFKNTSLRHSVEIFENFVKKLETSWKGKLLEKSDLKKEF